MEQVRVVLLSIVLALVALLCAYDAYDFFFPPHTDAEIELSFVDTWEVSALVTAFALVILTPLAVLSGNRRETGVRVRFHWNPGQSKGLTANAL